MKLTKKIAAVGLLAMTLMFAGCGKAQIGYVDGNKVMTDAPQIKAVIEEGNKKIEEEEAAAEAELAKNPNMTEEEVNKARLETQRKLSGIGQAYSTQLRQKLDVAMNQVCKEKKLDVVVDSSEGQKVVVQGGIDVTNEVIQKLQ